MQSNYSEWQKFWHTLLLTLHNDNNLQLRSFLSLCKVTIVSGKSFGTLYFLLSPSIPMLPGAGVVWGEREGLSSNLLNIN